MQQYHLFRLDEFSRLEPVEVDAAGDICVPSNLVIPLNIFLTHQSCNNLPKNIEDAELSIGRLRQ